MSVIHDMHFSDTLEIVCLRNHKHRNLRRGNNDRVVHTADTRTHCVHAQNLQPKLMLVDMYRTLFV